ncbi:hypothetical protein P5W99_35955 [Paraburkholderia sp. A3BS-1L]|uniref:hypothetical protein n=1 Tax=Paraburkholderia sp. A3BS-1L TaxID=3028375 RepID=UPI003DA815F7
MTSFIELVLVLAAMAVLSVQSIREDIEKHRSALLATEGQNEAVIVDALGSWITDNYQTLLAQYTQSGSATLTAPTITQLHTAGNLKQVHRAGPFWGGAYTIQLAMQPAGCSPSAGNCHVAFQFFPSLSYTRNGIADVSGAAQIALGANKGGQFGYSNSTNPGTITGINAAWTASNPLSGAPAAAIMATNGANSDGNAVYIRRDGSLTWTGDQNVNGVSLHNVNSVDATGTVAGPLVSASNVAVTNAIRTPDTLYVHNATGTAPAPINTGNSTVNGTLSVTQTITPGAIATPRTYCPTNGAAATNSDGRGQWLSCQDNVWMPVGGPAARYNYYTVGNGSVVPAPSCFNGGSPQIMLAPQTFYVDESAQVNMTASGAGPWSIALTDGLGADIGASAVVETYCAY